MATSYVEFESNLKPMRRWQREAVEVANTILIEEDRKHLYVCAPTASGKSRFMFELIEQFPIVGVRIIIVGLDQISDQLKQDFRDEFNCMVRNTTANPLFVTPSGQQVYIGTYQALAAFAKRLYASKQASPWDTALLFFDEIHVGGSNSSGRIGNEEFVDQSSIQRIFSIFEPKKRVYVSATTQTADEKILGAKRDHFYRYPMSQAFEDKILHPVDMVEVHTGTTMKIKRVEAQFGRPLEELETLSAADLDSLAPKLSAASVSLVNSSDVRWLIRSRHREMIKLYATKHYGEQAIFYCPKIEDAEQAARDFNYFMNSKPMTKDRLKHGKAPRAFAYHSDVLQAGEKLAAFESNQVEVLFVVGMLQEGFNMPSLALAFDCRFHCQWNPSKIARFVQKIGRLMRLKPGKDNSRYYYARDVADYIENSKPQNPEVSEDDADFADELAFATVEPTEKQITAAAKVAATILVGANGGFESDAPKPWGGADVTVGEPTVDNVEVFEEGFDDRSEVDVTNISQKRVVTITTPMYVAVDSYGRTEQRTFSFCSLVRSKSIDRNKRDLLNMKPGSPKPKGKHPLAQALANYTRPSLRVYDADFDGMIRDRQPQWFAGVQTRKRQSKADGEKSLSAAEKKKLLLSMEIGTIRPSSLTPIGMALNNYINLHGSAYDPAFDAIIRAQQPGWFSPNRTSATRTRASASRTRDMLLALPPGSQKPKTGDPLYRYLRDYTSESRGSFNAEFNSEIRKKQPHWFIYGQKGLENKAAILAMLSGSPRPHHSSRLGMALRSFIYPSSSRFDPDFASQVRSKFPEWFTK